MTSQQWNRGYGGRLWCVRCGSQKRETLLCGECALVDNAADTLAALERITAKHVNLVRTEGANPDIQMEIIAARVAIRVARGEIPPLQPKPKENR